MSYQFLILEWLSQEGIQYRFHQVEILRISLRLMNLELRKLSFKLSKEDKLLISFIMIQTIMKTKTINPHQLITLFSTLINKKITILQPLKLQLKNWTKSQTIKIKIDTKSKCLSNSISVQRPRSVSHPGRGYPFQNLNIRNTQSWTRIKVTKSQTTARTLAEIRPKLSQFKSIEIS